MAGDLDLIVQQLHGKLGTVVRVGPNEISIYDSDAADLCGHYNDIEKGIYLLPSSNVSKWLLGFGFLHLNEPFSRQWCIRCSNEWRSKVHHAKNRRTLARSYSRQSRVAMEEYATSCTWKYLRQMERLATLGRGNHQYQRLESLVNHSIPSASCTPIVSIFSTEKPIPISSIYWPHTWN